MKGEELKTVAGCKTCEWWVNRNQKERRLGDMGPFYINVSGHYTLDELMAPMKRDRDLYGDLPVQFIDKDCGSLNFSHPDAITADDVVNYMNPLITALGLRGTGIEEEIQKIYNEEMGRGR